MFCYQTDGGIWPITGGRELISGGGGGVGGTKKNTVLVYQLHESASLRTV